MSGYDKSKFVSLPQNIEEELTCGICLNVLNNPMTTPCCRHSYCRQCILLSLQKSSNPNTCPNDRQSLLSKDLIYASRVVTNILDKQEVYCDHKSYGCQQTCLLSQLPLHLKQCCFDPNKSSEKCNKMLTNLCQTVDRMKNRLKPKEFQTFKKQFNSFQTEIKAMASKTTSKTIYETPSSEDFQKKIISSAKNSIESHEIIESNIFKKLEKKVIKTCKEAINQSTDYNQIGQYLADCLNNDEYKWSAMVSPKHSSASVINNFVYKMELSFGDLSILVFGQYNQDDDDDDDDYTDVGDDYLDYSEGLEDEDEDDDEETDENYWMGTNGR